MNLSKSKYVQGIRCPKLMWLSVYKPEEAIENNDSILEKGAEVGELARGIFGDYELVEYNKDKQKMVDETNKYLTNKPNIICEASFIYDNNYCAVDILKNDKDGVEIYEVKSSSHINGSYINDISYQTWILKSLGLNVKKSYLVYINNKYIKHGKLDLNKLFVIEDVTDILLEIDNNKVLELQNILDSKEEPNTDLSVDCMKNKNCSYECPFFKYCTKDLPSPNVFDIGWKARFNKKLDMYYKNKITFEDVLKEGIFITNKEATEQLEFTINNSKPKINKDGIKEFLDRITYPLYFLDFESYQSPIPTIDGTKPNQQICFQYSLHYYLEENGELYHKEYLSDNYDGDPMYGLCKQLCEDIPKDTCVIVYNDTFEQSRLREMASIYPDLKEHLLNIHDNIVDLYDVFIHHDYYVKEMGGSASIKQVLPALFPDDPDLDYHNLDQVHKGDEASAAYLSLKNLDKKEEKILRDNMLKYCKLDTYAMVKIFNKLIEVIN